MEYLKTVWSEDKNKIFFYIINCWVLGGEGADSGSRLNLWLWLKMEHRGDSSGLSPSVMWQSSLLVSTESTSSGALSASLCPSLCAGAGSEEVRYIIVSQKWQRAWDCHVPQQRSSTCITVSRLFVISSFWGYESLSKYCHVCFHRTCTENITRPKHTKNGNADYFSLNYSISRAKHYKKSSISYYLHMSESIL